MDAAIPNASSHDSEGFASSFTGMFSFLLDPVGAARQLPKKWFWIIPTALACVVLAWYLAVTGPLTMHYMETAPTPANVPPDQYAKQIQIQGSVQHFIPFAAPLFIVFFLLLQSGLLLATSAMLAVRTTFGQLLNLIAGCGLISTLQTLAWIAILKMKGDITSLQDLKPPLGLDILLPAGASKVLAAALGFFSVFTIWQIVMMILIYSIGFRVTKGKAATAILPTYVLWLLLAMVGAAFQKG